MNKKELQDQVDETKERLTEFYAQAETATDPLLSRLGKSSYTAALAIIYTVGVSIISAFLYQYVFGC